MTKNNFNEPINPTQLAQHMAYWTFDLDDAVCYLSEDFPVRRIDEVLNNAIRQKAQKTNATEDDVKAVLRRNLGAQNATNINNWLKPGKVKSISRESAIRIVFALQMTYEEAEEFLKRCWLDGFYMRDIKDIIYRYGLEKCLSFEETDEMVKVFASFNHPNKDPDGGDIVQGDEFTKYVSGQYTSVKNMADLEKFIVQNEKFFGTFRMKAYKRFKELYDELKQILDDTATNVDNAVDSSEDQTEPYKRSTVPMVEICDMIVKGIPEIAHGKKLNANIRRRISEHVPTRTTMSEIINRYERNDTITQVDRKLLLLAYLASEDGDALEYPEGKASEAFMEHLSIINMDLLEPLGMAALDSRHPFDWIVMNSLSCAYLGNDDDADFRMQDLIERM